MAEFEEWRLLNRLKLTSLKHFLNDQVKLEVEFLMYFEPSAIFCKDGRIKCLDIQNRFKAICDLLALALGINDSCFFKVSAEKKTALKESVTVHLKVLETSEEVS